MELPEFAEAFIAGWTAVRRLNGPYDVVARSEARWLHDPTGDRLGELIGVGLPPARLVDLFPKGERGAIGAIYGPEAPLEALGREYRSLGWRLLRKEPAFVHPLRDLPPQDPRIVRASSPEHVARVAKAAGKRPETMGVEDVDDAPIRLYEALLDGQTVGWVRSVRAGPDAWVGPLNVQAPFRRQGLGRGLMAAMLADDARLGRRASVLLASQTGALLYPKIGYERVGTLLVLMPIESTL